MIKNLHIKVNSEIELKVLKKVNAIELFVLIFKNREWLEKYIEWISKIKTPYDVIDYINKNEYKSIYDKLFSLAIYKDDKIIGVLSFQNGDSIKKEVEIAYWIDEKYSRQGIVTASTKSLIDFAFSMTDVKSIFICCEIKNIRSYKIPQNLGFEFVREEEGKGYLKEGNPVKLIYKLDKTVF